MKNVRILTRTLTFLSLGVLASILPHAKADEWDQKTVVTFSAPVEIPGQVLAPGTYVFKLLDSMSDRDIVQVYNKDETRYYGTFLAIPDYHLKPAGKPVITFEERASGAPEAVRAWFYPGENYGHEFVYGKTKAIELAKANKQPVASMPNEMAANTTTPAKTTQAPPVVALKQAPLKAQKPTEEEAEIAEVFPVPPPKTATNLPKQLPKTGSSLPLVGLIGLLCLGAAGLLRRTGGSVRVERS